MALQLSFEDAHNDSSGNQSRNEVERINSCTGDAIVDGASPQMTLVSPRHVQINSSGDAGQNEVEQINSYIDDAIANGASPHMALVLSQRR